MKRFAFVLVLFLADIFVAKVYAWGFFAHQRVNRLAVFALPPEMIRFYKTHIVFVTENSTNPDSRRNVVEGEAPRHYIDIDVYHKFYGDSAIYKMPRYWKQAVERFTEDTLQAYGIVPWHIMKVKYELTEAFKQKNAGRILRLSADIGHYIADSNVPLHTTENYNGQLTGQVGIHGFWESRLPELFFNEYDFLVGKAEYLEKPQLEAWKAVTNAHLALDSVLRFEKELTKSFSDDKKFSFEERNKQTIRVYSRDFSKAYHKKLNGQVERRFRASIKMVADFWYTCWVDAGQPNLESILKLDITEEELKKIEAEQEKWKENLIKTRPHDTSKENTLPKGYAGCCEMPRTRTFAQLCLERQMQRSK